MLVKIYRVSSSLSITDLLNHGKQVELSNLNVFTLPIARSACCLRTNAIDDFLLPLLLSADLYQTEMLGYLSLHLKLEDHLQ